MQISNPNERNAQTCFLWCTNTALNGWFQQILGRFHAFTRIAMGAKLRLGSVALQPCGSHCGRSQMHVRTHADAAEDADNGSLEDLVEIIDDDEVVGVRLTIGLCVQGATSDALYRAASFSLGM